MVDPRKIRKADARQVTLGANELGRLANRIQEDFRAAIADHDARMRRFTRYYRRWRNLSEMPAAGEEQNPNFNVPLTQWQVYSKWAKEHGALFGDDADIQAKPIGPSDQRRARKASLFMTWAAFDHIKIQNPACVFDFRKILFGRSIALSDWYRDTFFVPLIDGSSAEEVAFEGPRFDPIWPDDFIVPAEDVRSLHEFSWLIHKIRQTPEQLLQGEEEGRYQGIKQEWEQFVSFASHKRQRDFESEMVKREKDLAEGVIYEGNLSAANTIIVHKWYGRWRMPKGKRDVSISNFAGREMRETELAVSYVPELHKIVGVQRLDEMYPRLKNRRPFVESSLVKDGSYWGPSFGELLESIELELTTNHRVGAKAGALSVGPVIVYKPASGFDPETFVYEPGSAIPSDDPNGVRMLEMRANLAPLEAREQSLIAISERLTGQTDMNIGRAIDRPNAPRTARQTIALLGEGDIRAELEMTGLREDWGEILSHFYQLYAEYAPEKLYFRVTEDDANGFFDVKHGQAYMTTDELLQKYDFDLKFATNAQSKEQHKQDELALYQIDVQNPLVVSNPRALWQLLDRVHKAFGDDEFADLIPQPPDLGQPKAPKEEWAMILAGEEIHVNPLDNDMLHLLDHNKRIQDAREDPDRDEEAFKTMVLHAMEHMQQVQQKKLMQQMLAGVVESLQNNTQTGTGLQQQGVPLTFQQLHQTLGDLMMAGGDPAALSAGGGQPGAPQPQPRPAM